jgi:hypothetical protein
MRNGTFILTLFASAIATLVFIAAAPQIPGLKTDPAAAWTNGLYRPKLAALHQLSGSRVYVVSGSSSLFSLDTKVLSGIVGQPVVNLATHAGLGLTYILDRAEREIQPGDVIIFTPEYELLEQPATPNQLTLAYVAFFDRRYIASRPLTEESHFYLGYGFPDSILETLKTIRTGVQVGRPDLTFDDLGNARGNTVAKSAKDKTEFAPHGPAPAISQDARAALRKFAQTARERHAKIIAFPAALIHLPGWDAPAERALRRDARSLFRQLGMVSLGSDQTGWVEPNGIYDSLYHANDVGRTAYTAKIARLLCREIHCAHPPP